jgi:hypothetical protein
VSSWWKKLKGMRDRGSALPVAYKPNDFVCEVKTSVPVCAVHDFSFEVVKARDIGQSKMPKNNVLEALLWRRMVVVN